MQNRIRTLRKQRGMTMKELGSLIGVAESTVSQYEKGTREPSSATLFQLSKLFDVSLEYLLGCDSSDSEELKNCTLGSLIKQYRTDHALSMQDFADRSGLTKGYISMLEAGKNYKTGKELNPTIETFSAVAKAMGIKPEELLSKCEQPAASNESLDGFPVFLRQLRKEKSLSQRELAVSLGLSKSALNMYERGEREPGIDTLLRISQFFNVSVDFLLGRNVKSFSIGENIKSRRKELGLSAEQLANAVGVSPSTFYRYENGEIESIPADILLPLAELLNLSVDALLGRKPVITSFDKASFLDPDYQKYLDLRDLFHLTDMMDPAERKQLLLTAKVLLSQRSEK